MPTAPFLSGIRLGEVEDEPADSDHVASTDAEFDPDDFPAWYRDKVSDAVDDSPGVDAAPDDAAVAEENADEDDDGIDYPFGLAAVQTVDRLDFGAVTVLAGDNGSGKSTLVEAIAIAGGFNAEGGSRNLMFATHDTHSDLHDRLILEWRKRPKWGWFLRAETFYGMASHITEDDDPEYGLAAIFPDLHNRSHGESFLSLARSRFTGAGLYLFDEPESALSIQGQMALAAIMVDSLAKGSQFIISTHSPFLMAFPGATVFQVDRERGLEPSSFDELDSTVLWRRFFADPAAVYGRLAIDE